MKSIVDLIFSKRSHKERNIYRRYFLAIALFFVLGTFFPIGPAFFNIQSGEYAMKGAQSSPDPIPFAIIYMILFLIWFSFTVPIFFGSIKNAIYVRITLWFGGILPFFIFPTVSLYYIESMKIAPLMNTALKACTISIPLVILSLILMKSRFKKVIQVNRKVIDFKRMQWALTEPLLHVSGKYNTTQITKWMVSAGFVGILFFSLSIAERMGLPTAWSHWGTFLLWWSIGWGVIGIYGGGDLYITWLVWRKSRKIGLPMLTAELVN